MTAMTKPYLQVKLVTPIKLPSGTYCKKFMWAEDRVYAGCPDFIISRSCSGPCPDCMYVHVGLFARAQIA